MHLAAQCASAPPSAELPRRYREETARPPPESFPWQVPNGPFWLERSFRAPTATLPRLQLRSKRPEMTLSRNSCPPSNGFVRQRREARGSRSRQRTKGHNRETGGGVRPGFEPRSCRPALVAVPSWIAPSFLQPSQGKWVTLSRRHGAVVRAASRAPS